MNPISELDDPGEIRHGLGPIWSATRVANPDFGITGPVTFHGGAVFTLSAHAWQDAIFSPILLPALRASLAHARRGENRELAAIDLRLSEQLGDDPAATSTRAGHRLALSGNSLRGDRLLTRLAEQIRAGATPGHFATVFAARCGAFSLPDRVAIGAYLFQEMCAGAPSALVPDVCSFVARCIEPLGGAPLELRAA